MQRTHHRLAAAIAATLAGIALAAAPALAGEDDDDDDDAQVQAPAVPAPVPVQGADSSSVEVSGAPVGGVETGAGGTAPQGRDAILLGLASGAIVLVATGGGLTLASRRTGP